MVALRQLDFFPERKHSTNICGRASGFVKSSGVCMLIKALCARQLVLCPRVHTHDWVWGWVKAMHLPRRGCVQG